MIHMDSKLNRYACTLLLMSAIFTAVRYISTAILVGAPCDAETFQHTMEALGPFLPVVSLICLIGGVVLLSTEEVLEYRRKNK